MLLPSVCYSILAEQTCPASTTSSNHAWNLAALSTTPLPVLGQSSPFHSSLALSGACARGKDVPFPQPMDHDRTRLPRPKASFYPEVVYQVKEGERPPLNEVDTAPVPLVAAKIRCPYESLRITTSNKTSVGYCKEALRELFLRD